MASSPSVKPTAVANAMCAPLTSLIRLSVSVETIPCSASGVTTASVDPSWLSAHPQTGDGTTALLTFCDLKRRGVWPSPWSFCSEFSVSCFHRKTYPNLLQLATPYSTFPSLSARDSTRNNVSLCMSAGFSSSPTTFSFSVSYRKQDPHSTT